MHQILAILALMSAISPLPSGKGVRRPAISERAPIAAIFRSLPPRIKRKTNIPILLPSELPPVWKKYRLYSYSETEANVWKITVGTEPNCGVNVCLVGYLEAKRGKAPPKSDEVDKVVRLAKGIKGYYDDKSCGGSCTPPQISWVYEGVLYTIQFRVESKGERGDEAWITWMANSAIINGPR